MEIKENNQKKVLLSVLGVAILVVAVIGISFAAYSTTFYSKDNSVTTGTIMVSYTEPTNAILITDAMPLSDANGKALTGAGKTFDFTVSTKADSALTIPYEVNLTKVTPDSTMLDTQVKVYLTKAGTGVTETGENGVFVDDLANSTVRADSKVLHRTSDVFTTPASGSSNSAVTTSYVLRMWIGSNINYDDVQNKEYHAKVNVDSSVTPITAS